MKRVLTALLVLGMSSTSFANDAAHGKKEEKKACTHCKDEKSDKDHKAHGHDAHPNDSHEAKKEEKKH